MDSQTAKQILTSYIGQKKNELEAFNFIEDLFTNGYTADQARIDTDVQAGRDAVAAEITAITEDRDVLAAQVTDLQFDKNKLSGEKDVLEGELYIANTDKQTAVDMNVEALRKLDVAFTFLTEEQKAVVSEPLKP